jgi:hypothetical protein
MSTLQPVMINAVGVASYMLLPLSNQHLNW